MRTETIQNFIQDIWSFYDQYGRHDLPWRIPETDGSFDPYKILVSELMLQQTQVPRVIPKYHEFLAKFPDVQTLAQAGVGDVLITWSGLGYNRRAKFLWQDAQLINDELKGVFPENLEGLMSLPGVGKNTAGAILAYAFNKPSLFVETNIRTVYIHHFFTDHANVSDASILGVMEQTIDLDKPREWYWALMDYGTHLKQTVGNVARVSDAYSKQSKFEGSKRQVRGQVLRALHTGPLAIDDIVIAIPDDRLTIVLNDLESEGLIQQVDNAYMLA